jgi:hypothetical protein
MQETKHHSTRTNGKLNLDKQMRGDG